MFFGILGLLLAGTLDCGFGFTFGLGGGTGSDSGSSGTSLTLTSMSPQQGLYKVAQTVTVTGTNFNAGDTVSIGGTACQGLKVISATQLQCTTQAVSLPMTANVVVQASSGGQASLAQGYRYLTYAYDGRLNGVSVDPSTAQLTLIPGSPFSLGSDSQVRVHPAGTFIYKIESGAIFTYSVDAATGVLTHVNSVGSYLTYFQITQNTYGTYLVSCVHVPSGYSYHSASSAFFLYPKQRYYYAYVGT